MALIACSSPPGINKYKDIPSPPDNPITEQGVALGRYLFFSTTLSLNEDISCASCHLPGSAFASNARTAAAHKMDAPPLNVPPLFNLAWHNNFFYNGGGKQLESAVLMPLINEREMAAGFKTVLYQLNNKAKVRQMAINAFEVDTLNAALIARALAQYLRTVVSFNTKLDSFSTTGDTSILQTVELAGLSVYTIHCKGCHPPPLFTDLDYHKVIRYQPADNADLRRAQVSRKEEDTGKVKTPSLRNLKFTFPYGHTGKFKTLEEIIYAHDLKVMLSEGEVKHLLSFLNTLNDHHSFRGVVFEKD